MTAAMRLDPDLAAIIEALGGGSPFPASDSTDPQVMRNEIDNQMRLMLSAHTWPAGVQESQHTTTSTDGSSLSVFRYLPESLRAPQSRPQRAVVFVFGGGTVAGSIDVFRTNVAARAEASQTQHFAVAYRLAPEHPFPAAIEDVYSAVCWLQKNASGFDVDPARIVLVGASAGGLLTAGVTLYARDHKLSPPIAGQLLQYPMLDDRTIIREHDPLKQYLTWTVEKNDIAWNRYLGKPRDERNDENTSAYASPGRAKDLSNLPRTYIEVGGLDLFRDEVMSYSSKMAAANGDVELHLYPGVVHGFDGVPSLTATKSSAANQKRFLESF